MKKALSLALPFSVLALSTHAVMLTQDVCAKFARHEAAGNVEYQDGVKVRGDHTVTANVRKKATVPLRSASSFSLP